MNNKQQSTKTVHALKSSYTEPSWPTIPPPTEAAILDRLLPLIEPIGQHRKKNIPKSRGRSRKRRFEKLTSLSNDGVQSNVESNTANPADELPIVQQYLTSGFNSSVRHLESLAQRARPDRSHEEEDAYQPVLYAVLVCVSVLPSIMTAPLPYLTAIASISRQSQETIRLVPMSQTSALKIAEALAQPRAHVIGILEGCPGGAELEHLIRGAVDPVKVPWIQKPTNAIYRPVNISSEETVVSKSKTKNGKRKREDRNTA